jgi:hypothetical protein
MMFFRLTHFLYDFLTLLFQMSNLLLYAFHILLLQKRMLIPCEVTCVQSKSHISLFVFAVVVSTNVKDAVFSWSMNEFMI